MIAPTLRTERLTLRAPAPRDARVITKAVNNLNVSRWLTMVPYPYGMTDAEWFINETAKGRFNAHLIWHDAVFVGTIGVDDGFGYWLAEEAWGKGYATEAGQAVLQHHFATTDANLVESSYFDGNTASQNVLKKLGFLDTGPVMHFSKARNEDVPGRSMELTRERWQALCDA
jgi:RimJ/RimL family protein N-acetyltransferase